MRCGSQTPSDQGLAQEGGVACCPPVPVHEERSMASQNSGAPDSSQPPQEPTPRARASDADREAVVRTLHDAVTRGLLTLQEGDERMAAAYAARFLDDLPSLTADLPPAAPSAPVAPGWRALVLLAWLQ